MLFLMCPKIQSKIKRASYYTSAEHMTDILRHIAEALSS